MKGFRKMDEMEMSINLRAVRLSWAYGFLFLLVWVIYDRVKTGAFNTPAFLLMTSQTVVYWAAQLYFSRKMSSDEK